MYQLQIKIKSPIGPLFLVSSRKGLCGVHWNPQLVPFLNRKQLRQDTQYVESQVHLLAAKKQLGEYFSGKRKKFELCLDFQGTTFQKKVWSQLIRIPYGKTQSYKDIAVKIKSEKAFRAVGTANGRNPLSIVIPCHRVISNDGTLGGYAGGLKIKTKLLNLEKKLS